MILLHLLLTFALTFLQIPMGGITGVGGGGGSAPTFVQEQDCHWFGGSGTSETCTFGSNVAAGNSIIMVADWNNPTGSTISSVANTTPTDTYTAITWASGAANCASAANYQTLSYYAKNSAGGANASAIKVTWGADPGAGDMRVFEVNGANSTTPLDNADCQHNASSTSVTSPSVTTTAKDFCAASGMDSNFNTRTWTAGGSFTIRGTTNSWFGQGSQSQTSAGAISGALTINTADPTNGSIVCLKP